MTAKATKCPLCDGPAICRYRDSTLETVYYETCWNPKPPTPDESRKIAHKRANKLQRELGRAVKAYRLLLGVVGHGARGDALEIYDPDCKNEFCDLHGERAAEKRTVHPTTGGQ